ncbi:MULTISPECIES: TetR/AcrR family transcriptional regulator [unclassified Paenibacillus]|uniref:TetR/AcrR family transcriptional regulator n=1 Tax=unclassified Paenibacillus TaxID=185978 RepID=UPI001C0FF199|nr:MULTISPECIES: TetR family transcriptional regulator [unclassified Paenibacillus]MBU5442020.1 TetR family transcriptional regulator [Paenibacillus sp. MSJ-34]CAH0120452.1 hypothetical protein PAE9249_02971 [Paenibacillus sp. CECT 9249]
MSVRDKIVEAALRLAADRPADKIGYADVAEAAGVHWTTVRRHLGSKQEMRALLAEKQPGAANADTKTRILEAAARVFAEQGYAGTTLDDVAADAGMTKGAVYWHFAGKSDLYLALCEKSMAQQLQGFPKEAESMLGGSDPQEALAAWLSAQLAACATDRDKPMLFFEFIASSRDPAIRDQLRRTFAGIYEQTGDAIREIQERGLLAKDVDPTALAVLFNAMVNGLVMSWLIDPDSVRLDQFAPNLSRILWDGLAPADVPR